MADGDSTEWTIYSIHDPRTDRPFYVGQTLNLPRRIFEHLKQRDKASSAVSIGGLLDARLVPTFRIIAVCSNRQDADRVEFEEIAIHLAAGFELANSESEINHARKILKAQPRYIAQRMAGRWPIGQPEASLE
jgi:hypothetical protein